MSFSTLLLAFAPPPAGGGNAGAPMWSTLLFFGAMILIFYFMILRPQKKRQQEQKQMIESLKKGDKVVTHSGIHGTVSDVEDTVVVMQIADNVKIRVDKTAVGVVQTKQ
jgi:preprotein translocase subunit YajC